jgi:hypothetical protein
MARPKKSVEDEWFDVFMTWSSDDQAAAIRTLRQLQRQQDRGKLETPRPVLSLAESAAAIGEEAQS